MLRVNNIAGDILYTTAQEALNPGEDLKVASGLLQGETYWLSFGTALGFYRDKDFIQGDTDIDISVLNPKDIDGIIERFSKRWKFIRQVTFGGEVMQAAFQGEDRFIIDLSFFYEDEQGLYNYCEGGMWRHKPENVLTPVLYETKYGKFPIPKKIENYLEARYGDWKTPRYGAITSARKA